MSGCCHGSACENASGDEVLAREARTWLRLGVATLLAGQAMTFSLAVNLSPVAGTARWVIHGLLAVSALGVFVLAGLPILRESWNAAMRGRIVFEQFFFIGIASAFAASVHSSITGEGHIYYEVVAVLVAIYTFGTLLAKRRQDALRDSVAKLGAEFDSCERIVDGRIERVSVTDISVGDHVLVGAGQGVPVDGVVIDGVALVFEAALTGEPYPVVKRVGDQVFAGSKVEDSSLRVSACTNGYSRRIDRLLRTIDEARRQPSRIQREADKLVAWFLPVVLIVALLTTIGWTLSNGWITGVFNGLAVLLIACPCAMGLATPVAIWSALAALAKRGLIARSGDAIEALSVVDTAVFDKTGTLSESDARLVDFVVLGGVDRQQLLREIAAVQTGSSHPIARAFRVAVSEGEPLLAESVRVLPGAGIEGSISNGKTLQIGNASILKSTDGVEELRGGLGIEATSGHEIYIRSDGRLVGLAVLRESLRDSARPALEAMRQLGLRSIVMTGDREENAMRFGFAECLAGMTPDGKLCEVEKLKAEGRHVLFIGDGINDAPAMAAADTSIALSAGNELPRETAALELNGQDLRVIAQAIALSRATIRAIRRNIAFAACYNIAGIALAAAGILHPIVAALIMLVSSMIVTWSVLRETSDVALEKAIKRQTLEEVFPKKAYSLSPSVESGVFALALALQGPVIALLGNFRVEQSIGLIALFLAAGGILFLTTFQRQWQGVARMFAAMFSVGGLAMLMGWWVDAGFASVVADGKCLCRCGQAGEVGGGVMSYFWMDVGMLIAAVPGLFIGERIFTKFGLRIGCWGAGVVGMFVGMWLGGEVAQMTMANVDSSLASARFFVSYAGMLGGMTLGMLVGCSVFQGIAKVLLRKRENSDEERSSLVV